MELNKNLAPHETLEINELLSFKTICMTKAHTMQSLVSDPDLKVLLQDDVRKSTQAITELKSLIKNNPFSLGGLH